MYIYKITNTTNNKIYIGQTIRNPEKRWQQHRYNAKSGKKDYPINRALNKYGKESFNFEVIKTCNSIEEMYEMEKEFIKTLDSTNPLIGYNLSSGGEGGGKHSEITKEKISQIQKGKKLSEEHKRKISESGKGKKHSEETKQKLRITSSGRQFTDESRKKMSDSQKTSKLCRIANDNKQKTYVITFPDGHEETITGMNKFCILHGLRQGHLIQVARGTRNHHQNFKARYL